MTWKTCGASVWVCKRARDGEMFVSPNFASTMNHGLRSPTPRKSNPLVAQGQLIFRIVSMACSRGMTSTFSCTG